MSFDFTDKHVVVCGGSRGIGRAIAIGFAKAGAKVSICARGKEALEKTKAELGKGAHAATCDLSNKKAVEGYIAKAAKALGSIDVLINNASGFGMTDSEEDWEKSLSIDVLATVRASKAALAHFPKKGGAIVNISSISGFRASGRGPSYAAVKALLFNYTQSQALALAPKGIRVNCIAPGSIEFPGGSWEARKKSDPKLYKAILDSIPYGRLGYPEEVADVALFFASPAARWVTGQTISVDGGQLLTG